MSRIFDEQTSPHLLRRLAGDRSGVTAIVTGIGLTMLLGFAGAAIDVAYWLNAARGLQSAADQAAYSAAVAAGSTGCSGTTYTQQARAVAAARGYINGQNATTVSVSCRPSDVSFTVRITQDQPRWFTNLFLTSSPSASAQATSQAAAKVSDVCVLALAGSVVDEGVIGTDTAALWLNGNSTANLHCGVAVDSSDTASLSTGGSSGLSASSIYLLGDMQGSPSGSSTIATTPTANNILKNQTSAIADPYGGRPIPAHSSCGSYTPTTYDTSGTLNPGVFCGGLTIGSNAHTVHVLNPGIYYVVGGNFEISSKASVTSAGGVTFVLTGDSTHGYASATINGSADVALSAPTSGPTGGMLFFQDRNAPFSGGSSSSSSCGSGSSQNQINGGSTQFLTGALYFPSQSLCYGGNSSTSGAGKCTQIIARQISFTGTSDVKLSCEGTGVDPVTVPTPQLIR
jgi:Flp pilus assembly protein TadG